MTALLFSCRVAYRVILGVDSTPEFYTEEDLKKECKKFDIPLEQAWIMDTSTYYHEIKKYYKSIFEKIDKQDSIALKEIYRVAKDDSQPVQLRVFDREGVEIFKTVNCYLDPPIPMDWNSRGAFNQFPPKTEIESLNQHHLNYDFFLNAAHPIDKTNTDNFGKVDPDYFVIVIWNTYMKRASRKLIKLIGEKFSNLEQSIEFKYINNNNALIWQLANDEQKEKILKALKKKKNVNH